MTATEDVKVEKVKTCLLCGKQGELLYSGLRDSLFNAPGDWHLLRCPQCGLVWLSPRPIEDEFGKLYNTYYTHAGNGNSFRRRARSALLLTSLDCNQKIDGWRWKLAGHVLYSLPFIREAARVSTMQLRRTMDGKLLDVGCGNGEFLSIMLQAGWRVLGIDQDSQAADFARTEFGIPVHLGTLEPGTIAEESVDVLTMRHVIEHLPHPDTTLHTCWRSLRTGGRLIVLTPNVESLSHRLFRQDCVSLDPPRHLYLFSLRTLRNLVERAGFRVEILRTSTRLAGPTWATSTEIRWKGKRQSSNATAWGKLTGIPFSLFEKAAHRISPRVGEELVLIARKTL
jgi:SAM-dependent methyltransferase